MTPRLRDRCRGAAAVLALALALAFGASAHAAGDEIVIGSKAFTESVVLGEIATQALRADGFAVRHRRQLGGSRVLFDALLGGQIDAYPEYTGTLTGELLAAESLASDAELAAALAERGLRMSPPLGFSNTYVLGVRPETAERHALRTISDLRAHPALEFGFSNEFLERADGWPRLREVYALNPRSVRGLEHSLAYRALAAGQIAVTDLYSTDPEIVRDGLVLLEDDLGVFPDYRAAWLHRIDLAPAAVAVLERYAGRISAAEMSALNARVLIDRASEASVARDFLGDAAPPAAPGRSRAALVVRHAGEHVVLTLVSLLGAIAVGVPIGILAASRPTFGRVALAATGLVQTIPALALLVFMIPLFGIGFWPAVVALFLYGLLPIVRNTASGLLDIPKALRESALALGLSDRARLLDVELRLAARSILAGVKTAAVINVGTATLGALIGAGGLGQLIIAGIRVNDLGLIMAGAVPAALLALAVQGAFDGLERLLFAPSRAGAMRADVPGQ